MGASDIWCEVCARQFVLLGSIFDSPGTLPCMEFSDIPYMNIVTILLS
jgi:hypothetical protein